MCNTPEEYKIDLTLRQFKLLSMVAEAPNTSILRADMFHKVDMGNGVLSRNLGKLEQKRVIILEPWEKDTRQYVVKLDRKGREVVSKICKIFKNNNSIQNTLNKSKIEI